MSLFDIDKKNVHRGMPNPSVIDKTALAGARPSHGTPSINYVTDATDPVTNNGLLDGSWHLVQTGLINHLITAGGGTLHNDTTMVAHGLPYVPFVMGVFTQQSESTGEPLPTWLTLTNASIGGIPALVFQVWIEISVDDTNINIDSWTVNDSQAGRNVAIRYYLFRQTST